MTGNPWQERRFGRFSVSGGMLGRFYVDVQAIFAEVVPLRSEYSLYRDALDVEAMSPHFEPVPPAQEIPAYDVIVEDGKVTFRRSDMPLPWFCRG